MTPQLTQCPSCGQAVTFEARHTGFNNTGYAYCDRDGRLVLWDTYDPTYTDLVGNQHPWTLGVEDKQRVNKALAPCPCGGRFGMDNPPRCPHCATPLTDLLPDKIYFADFGNRLQPPAWEENNADVGKADPGHPS